MTPNRVETSPGMHCFTTIAISTSHADRRAPRRRPAALCLRILAGALHLAALGSAAWAQDDPWSERRAAMVRTIESYAPSLSREVGPKGLSRNVLDVMGKVPRHRFVPGDVQRQAYADTPLPIGHGQTISQPLIVALMTHLLEPGSDSTVLEIGTGSGYQAAVLSPLVRNVCTIEIVPELAETAARRLADLGYRNVRTRSGDGYFGWPECGPFDGIIVTAAAGHVPPPLVKQLKPGGRMVIPVGSVFGLQHLTLVRKTADGQVKTRQILPVRFVPFTRGSR